MFKVIVNKNFNDNKKIPVKKTAKEIAVAEFNSVMDFVRALPNQEGRNVRVYSPEDVDSLDLAKESPGIRRWAIQVKNTRPKL